MVVSLVSRLAPVFFCAVVLLPSDLVAGPADAVPTGLSAEDWAQIRDSIDAERYQAKGVGGTCLEGIDSALYADSYEQQLRALFTSEGIELTPRDADIGWRIGMRLARWGWDTALQPSASAQPEADGNRIEYRRGELTEWFVNDQRGLEHGFTIKRPPIGETSGTLRFELTVSGGLQPSLASAGRGIEFSDERGNAVVRYAELQAWDAESRVLDATLSVRGDVIGINVDTADAVFPITVDPWLTHVGLELPTPDPFVQAEAHFGAAVAVDGDTAVVGAPDGSNPTFLDGGAAYVYVRSGDSWHMGFLLQPLGGLVPVEFGASVAIDGDTIVVGDPGAEGGEGRVYVYSRAGDVWNEVGGLMVSDIMPGDEFGTSVAIDGVTIVVGASYDDNAGGVDAGSSYVFTWSGTLWQERTKLTAADGAAGDRFGESVTMSGGTIVVGAPYHDHVVGNAGAAYVFVGSGSSWTQQAELMASDRAFNDFFGMSVSLDGESAVVGAEWDDHAFNDAGSAYVFTRSGTSWSEQAKLVASDAALTDRFGKSVSIDGDTVVVGSHYDNHSSLADPGSAYVFSRSGTTWSEQAKLVGSTLDSGDRMGISVALSGDAVFAGASRDDHSGLVDPGSAWIFSGAGASWSEVQNVTATDGAVYDYFGNSVAISGDTAVVGAPGDSHSDLQSAGSVRVLVRSGDNWMLQARLTASDAADADFFGSSVSIDGDTLAIAAKYDDHSSHTDTGSVYVFVRSGTVWTEQQKLTASDPDHGDYFGDSVALDGDTVLVGASSTSQGGILDAGSAYVFVRSGTVWSQQQKLTAADADHSDRFGSAVALEGDTALIGAHNHDVLAYQNAGSVYIFTRSGSTWSQQTELTAPDRAADDEFGSSVAINGDRLMVGAPYDDNAGGIDAGSAYLFERSGSVWQFRRHFYASDPAQDDRFGASVSVWSNWIAIGKPAVSGAPGAAYPFFFNGMNWFQQLVLTAADPVDGDYFGSSLAIENGWLFVGAVFDDHVSYGAGSVAIFRWYFADLSITKDDGQSTAIPGEVVTYNIVAGNPTGPDDVVDATVLDFFSAELVGCAWSCSPSGGASCAPSGIGDIYQSVDLPVGGEVTYTANCIVAPGATGSVTNVANVYGQTVEDGNPSNDHATDTDVLTPQADLRITNTDGQTDVAPGSQVVYTITAANDGLSDAPGVVVTDTFPDELSCAWSCVGSGATCTSNGTGPISDIVDLPVGTSVVFTATCNLSVCATGSLINAATVDSPVGVPDPFPTNNSATDIDQILVLADTIFVDCFESGDTSAWSTTAP